MKSLFFGLLATAMCNIVIADQPNVLILFTDDQRADTIHALGNSDIITPNLDELASRGANVSSAYCLGANMGAVCRPSRNMLLSGRTYFRWANPIDGSKPQRNAPQADNTLPAVFNAAGYETYHHGKRGNTAQEIHKQFDHSHYLDDFGDRWSMEAGTKIVDDAMSFLTTRDDRNSPWLMYLAFATPHDPRAASPEALAMYDAHDLTLPADAAPVHPFDNGAVLVRDEWTAVWPRSPQVLRDQLHDYYATITTIDANIGRLVADLERRGELDNTIVVFSSDHGLSMGSQGLMGKQNVYEAGYKAPMVIAGPGVLHKTVDDPVYLMDLFPTLCDLTGVGVPDGLDGLSFAAMLTGEDAGPRDAVMLSYTDVQRSVRHDGWKLIRYPKIHRTQLFNLSDDPHEQADLADDPDQAARIDLLMTLMRQLQVEQGDTLPLTNESPDPPEFVAPQIEIAESVRPALPPGKPGLDDLHSTTVVGWTMSDESKPFTVVAEPGEVFTAIAVGMSRSQPTVVTGLRFDLVVKEGGDASRRTVVAGDPDSRWTPLLDQLGRRQIIGVHGAAGHVIDRLGFLVTEGRRTPPFGGRGGDTVFELQISNGTLAGFHGTITDFNDQQAIESLGLLFTSDEPVTE